jgi:hypothetical protein
MVGAGVALAVPALAGGSPCEGAGSCFTEGVVGAAAWVSLVLAQLASVTVLSKITKMINHEAHEASRRNFGQATFAVFRVFRD